MKHYMYIQRSYVEQTEKGQLATAVWSVTTHPSGFNQIATITTRTLTTENGETEMLPPLYQPFTYQDVIQQAFGITKENNQ